jgi:hypothetical protein
LCAFEPSIFCNLLSGVEPCLKNYGHKVLTLNSNYPLVFRAAFRLFLLRK